MLICNSPSYDSLQSRHLYQSPLTTSTSQSAIAKPTIPICCFHVTHLIPHTHHHVLPFIRIVVPGTHVPDNRSIAKTLEMWFTYTDNKTSSISPCTYANNNINHRYCEVKSLFSPCCVARNINIPRSTTK